MVHSMAYFIEKVLRFRFKFSDFYLHINILTILKLPKWPDIVHNDTCHNRADMSNLIVIYPTVAFVQDSQKLSVLNNYIWLHGSLICIHIW